MPDKPQEPRIIHDPRDAKIFITGGEVEAIDSQTVRLIFGLICPAPMSAELWQGWPHPLSVAMEMNAKMRLALSDTIRKGQR